VSDPRASNPILAAVPTEAALFRDEATRARRYSAAMSDSKIVEQLNQIAMLYEGLAAGQDPGPTDRD
jgi:Flp pilus assembly CpaE family ATPase